MFSPYGRAIRLNKKSFYYHRRSEQTKEVCATRFFFPAYKANRPTVDVVSHWPIFLGEIKNNDVVYFPLSPLRLITISHAKSNIMQYDSSIEGGGHRRDS